MITPMPCGKDDPIKPGMAMRPFLGIDAVLLDDRVEFYLHAAH